jgi:hypothetical protein
MYDLTVGQIQNFDSSLATYFDCHNPFQYFVCITNCKGSNRYRNYYNSFVRDNSIHQEKTRMTRRRQAVGDVSLSITSYLIYWFSQTFYNHLENGTIFKRKCLLPNMF